MARSDADSARHAAKYAELIANLSARNLRLWHDLVLHIDEAFPTCRRFWRSNGYFIQADRNFASLAPRPKLELIEVNIHANYNDLPPLGDLHYRDKAHSERIDPRIQVLRVRQPSHVPGVIQAARVAEKQWGRIGE